jgi:cell wall-associated NlpC family hydrolase
MRQDAAQVTSVLDPLLHPHRPDLAAAHLEGQVEAARFVEARRMQVSSATAPVHEAPRGDAQMISQALHGEQIDVYEEAEGWAWGQLCDDGYVGYVPAGALSGDLAAATHKIIVPRTFVYWRPDIKSVPAECLTLEARLAVEAEEGDFLRTANGAYVYKTHVAELGIWAPDFVAVAASLIGAPYLWGGKSVGGIDCSGLVQLACRAAGIAALRDTYMQRDTLGTALAATDAASPRRGDIVFWKGHVGIMSDPQTLLHATAHTMLTLTEPAEQVIRRNADIGLPVLQINRL